MTTDYKKLVAEARERARKFETDEDFSALDSPDWARSMADAIDTLMAERDAALNVGRTKWTPLRDRIVELKADNAALRAKLATASKWIEDANAHADEMADFNLTVKGHSMIRGILVELGHARAALAAIGKRYLTNE
jgi:hypothetical protein